MFRGLVFATTTFSQKILLKWRRLSRFPAKMILVHSRALSLLKKLVVVENFWLIRQIHFKLIFHTWDYTTRTTTTYRKLSGWLKCSLIQWTGVSSGGSMPCITTLHSLSTTPPPLENTSGTNSCNRSPRVRCSPTTRKQEHTTLWREFQASTASTNVFVCLFLFCFVCFCSCSCFSFVLFCFCFCFVFFFGRGGGVGGWGACNRLFHPGFNSAVKSCFIFNQWMLEANQKGQKTVGMGDISRLLVHL